MTYTYIFCNQNNYYIKLKIVYKRRIYLTIGFGAMALKCEFVKKYN